MHRLSTSFVLGYHGCDAAVAKQLLDGKKFQSSENDYDWLGSGIYFWEANPLRGLQYANELAARPGSKVSEPTVIGAVIELRQCLDLLTSTGVQAVRQAHDAFVELCRAAETDLPQNQFGDDLLLRRLDCAVINHLHTLMTEVDQPGFDSVRGVFMEGGRLYENSGFRRKTHIQICVRNADCIKGVFRVPETQLVE